MKALLIKELRVQLISPRFLFLLAIFTLVSALSFFTLLNQFNPLVEQASMVPNQSVSLNELVIEPFWAAVRALLLFLIPVLAMKSFASEREQKTILLLLVAPISSFKIAVAKIIPLTITAVLIVVIQFLFPLLLWKYAEVELMPALIGGLGVSLVAMSYIAIGGAISSFCSNQTLAGAITFLLIFALHSVEAFTADFGGGLAEFFQYISPNRHLLNIEKGLIRSSDLIYFASLILLSIIIASERLELDRGA